MSARTLLVLAVVGIAALQRLAELWMARRRLRRSAAETGATPEPEPAYAAMVALHVAWLGGCLVEPLLWPRPVPAALVASMAALWLAALALRAWTLHTLGRLWHVRIVRRARQPIVTHGPYRFIRHPNYVAVIVELAAVPLLLGAYGTAALCAIANAAVLTARIRREESYLMESPAYREAFGRKARFLPGVF